MNLGALLLRLEPLLATPAQSWDEICELLERHDELAEFEVARHFASRAMEPLVREMLQDVDTRQRKRGVRAVRQLFPRSTAGNLLRQMVNDSEPPVRSMARAGINALGLEDVRLNWGFPRQPGGGHIAPKAERAGLPQLDRPKDVAAFFGLKSAKALVRFTRPGSAEGSPYVDFEVPKARGGVRRISAPRKPLRRMQRQLLDELLAKLPVHEAAHGFVPGRSTVTNAEPHVGAALVVKLDLLNFFPSIHYQRVAGLFRHYGYDEEVADLLAALTTHRPRLADGTVAWPGTLPQGAPTSPALANLVCRRLDARLSGLARRSGARYTRYADDLTFSFAAAPPENLGRFLWWVDQICHQEGFTERADKRRVLRPCNQQRITGVVVNDGLTVPRAARRRFRAILHNCRKHGLVSQARGRDDFPDYLRGFAAYVQMVQPELGRRLVREVEQLLTGAS
jgi:RNA-directed DNA polymerase